MELSELVRLVLERFSEWGLPVVITKADIACAFDNLEHPIVDDSLATKGLPHCLRAAFLREIVGVFLSIQHQDAVVPDVELGKGGKQGATETPFTWNCTLDHVVGPIVRSWKERSLGLDLGDELGKNLTHGVWADDFLVFSTYWTCCDEAHAAGAH